MKGVGPFQIAVQTMAGSTSMRLGALQKIEDHCKRAALKQT
jgi:hypothetical protein